jgi:phosphoribosylformimino-5-aminoimidazole carboxamide ribotide isomerase/phosphoribosylanthranilate isomerase
MAKYPLALLPVVTISGGKARLAPPGYGASTASGTPGQAITSWVNQGAAWIHVVDQDAIDGRAANHQHIVSSRAHLQYSGDVTDEATLTAALATGASRIVIDATDLAWASDVVRAQGDRVAVGLDIRQPGVFDIASQLERSGCSRFVVTDRAEAHHWKHGDRHLLGEFCSGTNRPVMARGGIGHLNDLHELHELVPHGLDGIILDDALYEGAFTYTEAVAAGADRFDMFYWGPPQ